MPKRKSKLTSQDDGTQIGGSPETSGHSGEPSKIHNVAGNTSDQSNPAEFEENDAASDIPNRSILSSTEGRIDFKVLEELQNLHLEDLILDILDNRQKINDFANLKDIKDDEILTITNILATVCESSYREVKYSILSIFLNDTFIFNLHKSMGNLAKKRDLGDLSKHAVEFWSHLAKISENILDTVSESTLKLLHVVLNSMKVNIPSFEYTHKISISNSIKQQMEDMISQLLMKEKDAKWHKNKKRYEDFKGPPDDFRQIPIYPTSTEVLNQTTFLRPNVIKGPYKNVNHYLDVQFRLLREDFLRPLRSGVQACRSKSGNPTGNIRIYRKVTFLRIEAHNEHCCVQLRLHSNKNKKLPNFTRHLIYGSLVCFTKDDYKNIVFGRICEGNQETGEIIIEFEKDVPVVFNESYTMIECGIYFEPYFQVLKALQSMSPRQFPMEKYIIRLELDAQPPEYLTEDDYKYNINGFHFSPLKKWTNKVIKSLHLNESQLLAFKAALTQKFAIIQGPPGTGKTYLGLAITKTLLENQHCWHKRSPILVICYTNHALDQFLEGVLNYTDKIIRVGGRSKSNTLQRFALKGLSRIRNCSVFEKLKHLKEIAKQMKDISIILEEVDSYRGIIAFDKFEEVSPDTWFLHASKNAIINWLMEGRKEASELLKQDKNDLFNNEAIDAESEEEKDFVIVSLKSIHDEIKTLERTIKTGTTTTKKIVDKISDLKNKHRYLSMRLADGKKNRNSVPEKPKKIDLTSSKGMKPDDRWNLYFYWLKLYKMQLLEALNSLNLNYQSAYKEYEELRTLETVKSLREALVVGMTTSNAARLRPTLQSLKCPIVIVEEAAEILEAHIVACLTEHCQQLILIGDHQQLRPKTADFNIEKRFKLGISLLERMIINCSPDQYIVLKTQHRMRPEIATLISSIYPFLENHPSVNAREPIRGVDKCLFFIDHDNIETECEGTTKKNSYEISFFVYFAKYLILNGYTSNNITILTAYLGQMLGFQQEIAKHKDLKNIRITVLDNYQGEECDIILLSLVRSNNENNIGFLSTANRICVALSRARNGLYIMGNLTQLCKDSDLWTKVGDSLLSEDYLGPKLPLRCQVHPDVVTYVRTNTDFMAIPNGGCKKKCAKILECGHQCNLVCHTENMNHEDYRCEEECNKVLCDQGHKCNKKCYRKCGPCNFLILKKLTCGHEMKIECHLNVENYQCPVLVPFDLPCSHTVEKPCHQKPEDVVCSHNCDKILACGHTCGLICHIYTDPDHLMYKCKRRCTKYFKDCSMKEETHRCRKLCYEECDRCMIRVKKQRSVCSHVHEIFCNQDVDDLKCTEPCTKILECYHQCKKLCHEQCGDCDVKVTKTYPICGHSVKLECLEEPNRKFCNKKCPMKLSCGHPCTSKCNESCTTTCSAMVDCNIPTECGHVVTQISCHTSRNLNLRREDGKLPQKYCTRPCYTILQCGHRCLGNCKTCFQGRFHTRCEQKCTLSLICNHECAVSCHQTYSPCNLKCFYKCQHNSCSKMCNEICPPCKKKCPRSCTHQQCTQNCGDLCIVEPCQEPCTKKLKCGHDCIGFCGDPCPSKCFTCDAKYFDSNFKRKNERYVLLNDCKHIVEHSVMEKTGGSKSELEFITCPNCKIPVISTQRYGNYAKKTMGQIAKIKIEINGTTKENNELLYAIQTQSFVLKQKSKTLSTVFSQSKSTLESLDSYLIKLIKNKQKPVFKYQLETVRSKLNVIQYLIENCEEMQNPEKRIVSQFNFILNILKRDDCYLTTQEIEDISLEIDKFIKMVNVNQITTQLDRCNVEDSIKEQLRDIKSKIEPYLADLKRFSKPNGARVSEMLNEINELLSLKNTQNETEELKIFVQKTFRKSEWIQPS